MVNGHQVRGGLIGGSSLGTKQKFDFNEVLFRGMLADVRKAVEAGNGLPIVDPTGNLALGLVLDKLNDICDRLAKLEAQMPTAMTAEALAALKDQA